MKKTLLAVLIGIAFVGGAVLNGQINKAKDVALDNKTYVPYGTKPGG